MADTNIIRNFDALRETFTLNPTDHIMVGQRRGGLGNLAPRRIEANTFATQFFGLDTVQTLLCNFLDGAVESIGAGIPVYEGFDATTCMAQFRTLTAGTNVTLDDTTNPGEVIINAAAGGPDTFHIIEDNGTPLAQQPTLNFIGATVADNPGNNSTDVTISAGGFPSSGFHTDTPVAPGDIFAETIPGAAITTLAGDFNYYEVGKLLFIHFDINAVLDATIGPIGVSTITLEMPDLTPLTGTADLTLVMWNTISYSPNLGGASAGNFFGTVNNMGFGLDKISFSFTEGFPANIDNVTFRGSLIIKMT